ncbi:two-component sensor histidine kinase [Actinophytocola xinjiangensis]|uniref:histidine kinase n=1 Tax=Actinophytocola xinjiangensis TaxID=485602 RepID=A0A7Z0WFK6_9PSEU|nr:sensor histidine kinase [Actinophytocola xinjiangensis]OLF06160.1 two-component sensor histidine kinase [Actinophytocola xinjiangensis]
MRTHLATLWRAPRRPSVQDAALAALLLVGTWAGTGAPAVSGGWIAGLPWLPEPVARWVLVGLCVAAVAVRRRWPIPALAVATLAVVARMALAVGPVPADLAVPIVLYTIAVTRRRPVSLAVLGATLAVAAAWSVYVSLDGKPNGWLYDGPLGGGQERPPGATGPPPEPAHDDDVPMRHGEVPAALGPTAWGGIPVLGSLVVVAWAVGWGVRSRRAYLGELRARARDLERERDQRAALAAAAERARLTRDLHDVVAHGLAVIVMQAQGGAAAFATRPSDTLTALETIVATGRASLADIRHVLSASGQVDDSARPTPGLAQLPSLVDQVRRAGTPVELRVDGSPPPLPAGVDVSSYRIVQEALTNTMKHAGAGARAQVLVSYRDDELRLEASDDGTGTSSGATSTGNGLRGMRERVSLLGGEVVAGPGPDGGYVVRARIPLTPGETA